MKVREFLKEPYAEIYNELPYLVYDVETTNLDKGTALNDKNRMVMLTWKAHDTGVHVWGEEDFNLPKFTDTLITYMEDQVILVGHNIKFDLQWMQIYGLDLTKVLVWDTMVAEKVLLGNNPRNLRLDLGSVAQRYGLPGKHKLVDMWMKLGVCPSTIPKRLLRQRNIYDTEVTEKIFLEQRKLANEQGKLGVVLTRCLLTPVLADIERHGMYMDKERVMEEWYRNKDMEAEITGELLDLADINWGSPKQKAALLYDDFKFKELRKHGKPDRTDSGGRRTDADTIKKLKCTTKRQKKLKNLLLRWGGVNSNLTKYLNHFKDCVESHSILHFAFRQTVAATHRLSSTGMWFGVQGQNLPRKYKNFFKARKDGWQMTEGDGSNLEFRVAAELGDDEQARADIRDPEFDAHQRTADILTASGQETNRQDAKTHTFKPLYGGESGTEAERAYYAEFKNIYSGVGRVQEEWKRQALAEKRVTLPWGIEFFFPFTRITRSGYQENTTQICNYPVQSFATADIIPVALVNTWHDMHEAGMKSFIVNTVHDSIIIETHPDECEQLDEILVRNFTYSCYNYIKRVYNMTFRTPLGVGIKRGSHWSEGEETKIDIENDEVIE
jgi:DNA polymerase I-like protein with 3'-5' exonuclease and polymerase domains